MTPSSTTLAAAALAIAGSFGSSLAADAAFLPRPLFPHPGFAHRQIRLAVAPVARTISRVTVTRVVNSRRAIANAATFSALNPLRHHHRLAVLLPDAGYPGYTGYPFPYSYPYFADESAANAGPPTVQIDPPGTGSFTVPYVIPAPSYVPAPNYVDFAPRPYVPVTSGPKIIYVGAPNPSTRTKKLPDVIYGVTPVDRSY
ncbi:MAG: hypothetical protein JOZ40_00355 [Methylobacteriaceae bacterium]|nr:hypothetical protein [Methylobacteriaceae bacterium]